MEQYRLREAAELLGISYQTIKLWIYQEKVRPVKTPGGHHRIPRAEIERLAGARKRAALNPKTAAGLHEISGRNKLLGLVTSVKYSGLLAQVVIDIGGQEVTSIITSDACKALGLKKGVAAYALIKAPEPRLKRLALPLWGGRSFLHGAGHWKPSRTPFRRLAQSLARLHCRARGASSAPTGHASFRDVSTGDIPNVFVTSFTYELPFGKGRYFKLAGVANKLLGDWEIAGTVLLLSGLPLPVTQITNFNAFAGFGTQRPNILRNPALPADQRTTAQWFDTAAFAVAPQFTLGTASRNPVRGPGYRTADIAFIKRTYFSEVRNVEFRAEIFNLTNTPPLMNPNGVVGNAAFGTITSAGDPRVIQFGLKLNF